MQPLKYLTNDAQPASQSWKNNEFLKIDQTLVKQYLLFATTLVIFL
jgi:hypothetical protein